MKSQVMYADKLVEIAQGWILFRNYYFPFGSKRVNLSEVDRVIAMEPTLWNGKWRIHGTGDFRTWFPRDWKRPIRDILFIVSLTNSRRRIGFTVEDSGAVYNFFKGKGLLREGST